MPSTNRTRSSRKSRPAVENESAAAPPPAAPNPPPKPVVALHHVEQEATKGLERIGDILRRRRMHRGDDVRHIADFLCIRESFLVAIENSDYDDLPADAYAIGFLRSYAVYLGFDGIEAINRYRGEMAGRRRKPMLAMPTPIAEGRTPSVFIMIGAAVAAILIYAVWYGFSTTGRLGIGPSTATSISAPAPTANSAPPVSDGIALPAAPPVDTPVAAAPPAPDSSPPAAVTAPPPTVNPPSANASAAGRLVVRAEKETWVLVADEKGHPLLDRVMKPGDTFPVPDQDGLRLTTGNSSGIVLVLDGKDLPKLARNSSILHDIPLDIDKLKTGKAKPAPAPASQE